MNTIIQNSALRNAPATYATEAHVSRSDRYGFVPTALLVQGLAQHGWEVSTAAQARSRTMDKKEAAKHLLRFRRVEASPHNDTPELILINSHDGSSSYQMRVGYFRMACINGLIVGEDIFPALRVRHGRDALDKVIEGTYHIVKEFPGLVERVDSMRGVMLSEREQMAFASAALPLRFDADEKTGRFPIVESQLLRPRRNADTGRDLWTTFNVIQENVIKGHLHGRDANGHRRKTRGVNGIDQSVKLNQALWTLAEEMQKIKLAA